MSEWISVKDRLPDNTGRFLVYGYCANLKPKEFSFSCAAFHREFTEYVVKKTNLWFSDTGCIPALSPFIVTHWMELPEAPKDE